jgi:hypothetical protein
MRASENGDINVYTNQKQIYRPCHNRPADSEERYDESSTEYYEEEAYYSSGGGSIGARLMFFLIIQFVIAARGSLALFPRNDSDYKNDNRPPAAILFFCECETP